MRGRNGANALSRVEERFVMSRHPEHGNDQYSEQETQRRFERLVRAALNTKPKPLKSMTPKGVPAQSKKRPPTAPEAERIWDSATERGLDEALKRLGKKPK
jgi:hypothetical protein